jgi:ATP-dependent helicase HrpB
LEDWLGPFLTGITDLAGLSGIDVHAALMALLDWPARSRLDELAPTHFALPKGRKVKLDYTADPPVLATKLQDLFGVDSHPAVAGGRVLLSVHLLSPAGRPLQVTTDLPGFWRGSYKDVRKDMRGRYPKHKWPENPLENAG